jgi:Sulfotransferase domain
MIWIAVVAAGLLVFLVVQMIYLSAVLSWEDRKTLGLGYYGLPPDERERFRRTLRLHAMLLFPIVHLLGRVSKFDFRRVSFHHRGIAGPKGTCSKESFERVDAYAPRPEDVFVPTQMKCGTTWMLHVVYQVLRRGEGDLVESGSTLHAVSPWLEGRKTVPMNEAPLVGTERPSRVIKTHLPASHCPYSPEARYIYVARHPVSCFASCADFIATNTGSFAPPLDAIEEWFRSDELMWWGTWPAHVRGWWDLSRTRDNVLFVHFEDMKRDLPGVARQVASFLGVRPLSDRELGGVVHKCGFGYMQEHKWTFEMHPPHILAVDAELFVRGTADRYKDVPDAMRRRIVEWCAERMKDSDFRWPAQP